MRWKGPFKIEEKVGNHDYGVNMNSKVKTYRVKLLKKFNQREGERDHISASVEAGGKILELVSSMVLEIDGLDAENDDGLLFLVHCQLSKGFRSEVGEEFTGQKRQEREVIDEFQDTFTDRPERLLMSSKTRLWIYLEQ